MAKLTVLHYPDPDLRKRAEPVAEIDAGIRRLAADMLETMYAENGIGLAATQVNAQQRVVVIDLSAERNSPMYLINPEILDSRGSREMEEGCLSVPEYFDVVERAEWIRFRYQTLDAETVETETDGLLAVCVQHEIDHLNGRLFVDYLSSLKRKRVQKKLEKRQKLERQAL
ncbi:MAG: peptide deformylase [Gammaproteobacteria bacterium]|nr:peptide deformylase [Gammaproteobacteria bacterium]